MKNRRSASSAASTMKLLLRPMESQESDIFCLGSITTKYFHPIAKLLNALGMMPPEQESVSTTVCMTPKNFWYRSFGGCFMNSRWLAHGERVGPLTVVFDIRDYGEHHPSEGSASVALHENKRKHRIEYVHTKTLLFNVITLPMYLFRLELLLDVHEEPNNEQWDLVVNGFMFDSLLFNEKGVMKRVSGQTEKQEDKTEKMPPDDFYRNLYHVLLFDGTCVLCDYTVNFVIERDARRQETDGSLPLFKVAAIQSDIGQEFIEKEGIDRALVENLDSVLLVKSTGEVYTHSDAALQVAKDLTFPWSLLGRIGLFIPSSIRNVIYRFVATNRIKWFGSKNVCNPMQKNQRSSYL